MNSFLKIDNLLYDLNEQNFKMSLSAIYKELISEEPHILSSFSRILLHACTARFKQYTLYLTLLYHLNQKISNLAIYIQNSISKDKSLSQNYFVLYRFLGMKSKEKGEETTVIARAIVEDDIDTFRNEITKLEQMSDNLELKHYQIRVDSPFFLSELAQEDKLEINNYQKKNNFNNFDYSSDGDDVSDFEDDDKTFVVDSLLVKGTKHHITGVKIQKEKKKSLMSSFAAFYGSIKCFRYLLLNGFELDVDNLMRYAICGGNVEIIHLCEQKKMSFDGTLKYSIKYHHNEIFEWLKNNRRATIGKIDLLNLILRWCNIPLAYLLINERIMNVFNIIKFSIKYDFYFLIEFLKKVVNESSDKNNNDENENNNDENENNNDENENNNNENENNNNENENNNNENENYNNENINKNGKESNNMNNYENNDDGKNYIKAENDEDEFIESSLFSKYEEELLNAELVNIFFSKENIPQKVQFNTILKGNRNFWVYFCIAYGSFGCFMKFIEKPLNFDIMKIKNEVINDIISNEFILFIEFFSIKAEIWQLKHFENKNLIKIIKIKPNKTKSADCYLSKLLFHNQINLFNLFLLNPSLKFENILLYDSFSLIHYAVAKYSKSNKIDIIKTILNDPRTDVNIGFSASQWHCKKLQISNFTPLHIAVYENLFEIVELLLMHPNIDINAVGLEICLFI